MRPVRVASVRRLTRETEQGGQGDGEMVRMVTGGGGGGGGGRWSGQPAGESSQA